jgi:hypothetical protein
LERFGLLYLRFLDQDQGRAQLQYGLRIQLTYMTEIGKGLHLSRIYAGHVPAYKVITVAQFVQDFGEESAQADDARRINGGPMMSRFLAGGTCFGLAG